MNDESETNMGVDTIPASQVTRPPRVKDASGSASVAVEQLPPIPPQIGPYAIGEHLGRGGMGFVVKGFDTELQRPVAIKMLHPALTADELLVKRFLREARLVAKLDCAGICRVYALGRLETTAVPYLVMEFIDGHSLQERLSGQTLLSIEAGTSIIRETALALAHANEHGIIHRDVKPGNIMLNQAAAVTVTDFGLARLTEDRANLTAPNVVMGTPHYMAPECASGSACDHRADIYSLGATFFHVLAGHVPFDGPSSIAILTKHAHEPLPDLTTLRPGLPPRLEAIVEKMMAKKAVDRYSSYAELITALDDMLSTLRTPPAETCVIERPRRNTATKAILPIAVAGAIAGLAFCAYLVSPYAQPTCEGPPPVTGLVDTAAGTPTTGQRSSTAHPSSPTALQSSPTTHHRSPTTNPSPQRRQPLTALTTCEQFAASSLRKSAQGTVTLFLLCLHLLDGKEDLYWQVAPLFLAEREVRSNSFRYHTERLRRHRHWVLSYLGGTPDNGYSPASLVEPQFDERQSRNGKARAKLFVYSSGRDRSVPVSLRLQTDGCWQVVNWSSLAMPVRAAISPPPSQAVESGSRNGNAAKPEHR